MKYGDTLQQRSIPTWGNCEQNCRFNGEKQSILIGHATPDNVDYNDIKHIIKIHTSQSQAQAKAIPGSEFEVKAFRGFEDELYNELREQHQRVDLFVQSKFGEITRRLGK